MSQDTDEGGGRGKSGGGSGDGGAAWNGDKDAPLSTAPPSEPPSAAGNFESFLLHRVIFVTSGTNV